LQPYGRSAPLQGKLRESVLGDPMQSHASGASLALAWRWLGARWVLAGRWLGVGACVRPPRRDIF